MKYCKQCGLLMADDATTCPSCGAAYVSENPLSMPEEVPAAPDMSPYTPPVEPQPESQPEPQQASQQAPDEAQYATAGAAPQDAGANVGSGYGYGNAPYGAPDQAGAPQPGPAPQGGSTYYNQPLNGTPSAFNEPLTMGGYLFTLIIFMIPFVGFIMQLVWSFGGSENLARQSLSRAYLIRSLILFGIGLLSTVGIVALMFALGSSLSGYYY